MPKVTLLACPDEPPRLYTQDQFDAEIARRMEAELALFQGIVVKTLGEQFGFDPYADPAPVTHLRLAQ